MPREILRLRSQTRFAQDDGKEVETRCVRRSIKLVFRGPPHAPVPSEAKTSSAGLRALRLGAGQDFLDVVHVERDLVGEFLGGVELALAADPLDDFELDPLPVKVAVEIEKMRLD